MSASISEILTNHKCCVIIPTYNNQKTLKTVIEGCLKHCNDVWVINDGSTDDTRVILDSMSKITVIHLEKNGGKGAALRHAFDMALKAGFRNAITIDSDGQHDPEDIKGFAEALDNDPGTIYIGARNMGQNSIPGKSKFGHKNSNFWFWVETGIKAEDTQSGYRLYPLYAIPLKRLFTWRYEFEIEVIVRAAWKGTMVKFIPVRVYYPEDRVSHFRPFKDFLRVTLLNIWLVFAALLIFRPLMYIRVLKKKRFRQILRDHLLKPDEPASKKAFAMGVGIFCGIVPLWGFQTMIAIFLAFVFKLNKPITLLGSNISIPPMIPVIIYASMVTGGLILEGKIPDVVPELSTDLFTHDLLQYIVGSILFAFLAGAVGTILTWLLVKLLFRKRPKLNVEN